MFTLCRGHAHGPTIPFSSDNVLSLFERKYFVLRYLSKACLLINIDCIRLKLKNVKIKKSKNVSGAALRPTRKITN